MAIPVSLKEYFAAAGTGFTREDAEVIGPQLEEIAGTGEVSERTLVDVARSSNSPLNRYFEWRDDVAADKYRLHQASTMMRAIRVRVVEDGRPRVTAAYRLVQQQAKAKPVARGYNVLHDGSSFAAKMSIAAHDELMAWRAKYQNYIVVWTDFAKVFQGVANQIDEAEDLANPKGLDHETDEAIEALMAWRVRFGSTVAKWQDVAEQSGFLLDAINAAENVFTQSQAKERACMTCGTAFLSTGIGNRMCERCAGKSAPSGMVLG